MTEYANDVTTEQALIRLEAAAAQAARRLSDATEAARRVRDTALAAQRRPLTDFDREFLRSESLKMASAQAHAGDFAGIVAKIIWSISAAEGEATLISSSRERDDG